MAGENEEKNDQGGQNEGGGEEQPKGIDAVLARLDALQKENAELKAGQTALAQEVLKSRPQKTQAEGDDEEDLLVDQDTEKLLDRKLKATLAPIMSRLDAVNMQSDQARFSALAQDAGLTDEQVEEVERHHAAWVNQGTTINGNKPSRADVAAFLFGAANLKKKASDKERGRDAEISRREGNRDNTVERGGRQASGTGRGKNKDPEAMTRADRIKTYWPEKLDKDEDGNERTW